MARETSFVFTVDAGPETDAVLSRHAGACRFAFNQCLRGVKDALDERDKYPQAFVPWSGFDLINYFNAWKASEAAGRRWAVDSAGQAIRIDSGLLWRGEICAQVFEEAAVDLGRGLEGYLKSRRGERKGPRVGFPKFKKKGKAPESFRIRNRVIKRPVIERDPANGKLRRKKVIDPETGKVVTEWKRDPASGEVIEIPTITVGVEGDPRTIRLPYIGTIHVREDTRRLRRLLRPGPGGLPRARIHFATITKHRGRWRIPCNVVAPDLHPARRHPSRARDDHGGWVGVDRGLSTYALGATASGVEVFRTEARKALARSLPKLRRASKTASRKQARSQNRKKAHARLNGIHGQVADQRKDFLHRTTSELVKTHDRLCLEDLTVANMMKNRTLARHVGDAAWSEYHRQVSYKSAWYGSKCFIAPRFFASTKTCSACGWLREDMDLSRRAFTCERCDLDIDRDLNAAINLAAWAEAEHRSGAQAPDPEARGRVTAACGGTGAGRHLGAGETGPATSPRGGKKQEPLSAGPPA